MLYFLIPEQYCRNEISDYLKGRKRKRKKSQKSPADSFQNVTKQNQTVEVRRMGEDKLTYEVGSHEHKVLL